ncbi:MAG: hypothetical protein HZB26_15235 [Candidatus Hydrogenedentes bacterium]|nr:hypothetical protein [Candidatus Hydrogenedentota bacterium]
MKALKWLGISVGVLILFALILVVTLSARDIQWRSTVKPLTVDEIQRPAPHSTAPSQQDAESDHSLSVNEEPSPSAYTAPHPSELAALPTLKQVREHFALDPDSGRKPNYLSAAELTKRKAELLVGRIVTSAVSSVGGDGADRFCGDIHGSIGDRYLWDLGDLESARAYLRDCVRRRSTEERRGYYCTKLAWLEEDPRVVAALLEESCAAKPVNPSAEASAPCNALQLAVLTGSDELATYYYQRYQDSWEKWHDYLRPEVLDWIAAYNAKK